MIGFAQELVFLLFLLLSYRPLMNDYQVLARTTLHLLLLVEAQEPIVPHLHLGFHLHRERLDRQHPLSVATRPESHRIHARSDLVAEGPPPPPARWRFRRRFRLQELYSRPPVRPKAQPPSHVPRCSVDSGPCFAVNKMQYSNLYY